MMDSCNVNGMDGISWSIQSTITNYEEINLVLQENFFIFILTLPSNQKNHSSTLVKNILDLENMSTSPELGVVS